MISYMSKNFKALLSVDSAELNQIRQFKTTDATTNPSLVIKALKNDPGLKSRLTTDTKSYLEKHYHYLDRNSNEFTNLASDVLITILGSYIVKLIPGWVSTELDPRES